MPLPAALRMIPRRPHCPRALPGGSYVAQEASQGIKEAPESAQAASSWHAFLPILPHPESVKKDFDFLRLVLNSVHQTAEPEEIEFIHPWVIPVPQPAQRER